MEVVNNAANRRAMKKREEGIQQRIDALHLHGVETRLNALKV